MVKLKINQHIKGRLSIFWILVGLFIIFILVEGILQKNWMYIIASIIIFALDIFNIVTLLKTRDTTQIIECESYEIVKETTPKKIPTLNNDILPYP